MQSLQPIEARRTKLIAEIDGTEVMVGQDAAGGRGSTWNVLLSTLKSYFQQGLAVSLATLSDCNITSPAVGATLVWDGSKWVDGQLDLADTDAVKNALPYARGGFNGAVATTGITDGHIPIYSGLGGWATGFPYLDQCSDVNAPAPSAGQALVWSGTEWTPAAMPPYVTGTWSPNTFVGFSANPSITFTWEKIGNTVHMRVSSSTDGTSNADTFSMSGNMPAAITPAAARRFFMAGRKVQSVGGVDTLTDQEAVGVITSSGKLILNGINYANAGAGDYHAYFTTSNAGDGQGWTTTGANTKGLGLGTCFSYTV